MLITFDHILHTYAYQPCLTTGMRNSIFVDQGVAENQSGLVKLLIWNIWIKFCIVIYMNIVQPLVCKVVTRLPGASFRLVEVLLSIF